MTNTEGLYGIVGGEDKRMLTRRKFLRTSALGLGSAVLGVETILGLNEIVAAQSKVEYPAGVEVLAEYGQELKHSRRGPNFIALTLFFKGKNGDPIIAAADGKVLLSEYLGSSVGRVIFVGHGKEDDKFVITSYAALQKSLVEPGQNVQRGQKIALMGGYLGSAYYDLNSDLLGFGIIKVPHDKDIPDNMVGAGLYRTNPHESWFDGKPTCFDPARKYDAQTRFTLPLVCGKK